MSRPDPFGLFALAQRVFGASAPRVLRQWGQATQIGLTFGGLIGIPVVLLASFALSSLQAQELSIDADVAARAERITSGAVREKGEAFTRFERNVRRRLRVRDNPVGRLGELSPYVLAAFHLGPDGRLVEPFAAPSTATLPRPEIAYLDAWQEGRRHEQAGRLAYALTAFDRARASTSDRRLAGQAAFASARLRARLEPEVAQRVFADVVADFGDVRDERGFRVGDLARYALAAEGLRQAPEVGVVAMREFVDELLETRWTLGEPGEPALASRALAQLDGLGGPRGLVDPDWLGRARTVLGERDAQLYWAERLASELPTVAAFEELNEGQLAWRVGALGREAIAVWAVLLWEGELYLWAFDQDAVVADLRQSVLRVAAVDPDVQANVLRSDSPNGLAGAYRRTLAPELPYHEVQVAPTDPAELALRQRNQLNTQLVIVSLAVGTVLLGIALTARMVARELANARMKTDFAANVSHELRSPITQIRLKGEALMLGLVFDEADRVAHHAAIVRESERLSRLVDNVLDFAAIEQGAKKYSFRPEDVLGLVLQAVESMREAIENADMELQLDLPDDLPVVWVDREAMGQVLTNLLSNAIKYGASGGWIGVTVRGEEDAVSVAVADRGIGIAAEDQAQVFEHFFRSADPQVRRRKGTGIGLTIVRYIVEAHRGTISVQSAPGRGTTFTIRLPLTPPG